VQYQSRVKTDKVRLFSAIPFSKHSDNMVSVSSWFMEELPYPGVDLSKCRPKLKDSYPLSLTDYIESFNKDSGVEVD